MRPRALTSCPFSEAQARISADECFGAASFALLAARCGLLVGGSDRTRGPLTRVAAAMKGANACSNFAAFAALKSMV
jgi:hypothetical protein